MSALHLKIVPIVNRFRKNRERLGKGFVKDRNVGLYFRKNTRLIAQTITNFVYECRLDLTHFALVAMGGFAREEMYPYSDIDLLVLADTNEAAANSPELSLFLSRLWDLGLNVGANVRTRDEMLAVAQTDVTITTTFFESKFLLGNETLYKDTYRSFSETLDLNRFFNAKHAEMKERRRKYGNVPHELEPNIKEGTGGLRDAHTILWNARALGYGKTWENFRDAGFLKEKERFRLRQCEHYLSQLRIALHLSANRNENRLVFEHQEAVAKILGYRETKKRKASEQMMHDYYLVAKDISQMTDVFMEIMQKNLQNKGQSEEIEPLAAPFVRRANTLDITDPSVLKTDLTAYLRGFLLYGQNEAIEKLSPNFIRSVWEYRYLIGTSHREHPENIAALLSIFRLEPGAHKALCALNDCSLLDQFIPAFKHSIGLTQHDLFHQYTVDQHTLRVVRYMTRFADSNYAHEYPLCSSVMSGLTKHWRLTMAALFHDLGKGRGGNHSKIGSVDVERYSDRYGLSDEDKEFLVFLVREHLTMSQVAQKEDISDPHVLESFAKCVKTVERLGALYLLTVADIRATSPKIYTSWKAQLLETLYMETRSILEGKRSSPDQSIREKRLSEIEALLKNTGETFNPKAFLESVDPVYLMRHEAEDILWHAKELTNCGSELGLLVKIRHVQNQTYKVLIYTDDNDGLFARIVRTFETSSFSVLDARIQTTREGKALDTFVVEDKREREYTVEMLSDLESRLGSELISETPLTVPSRGKLSRHARSFPIEPEIEIEASSNPKLFNLKITCHDRVGLLYAISFVLNRHAIDIASAKIVTLGERVEDVFLIENDLLAAEESQQNLRRDLLKAIENAT